MEACGSCGVSFEPFVVASTPPIVTNCIQWLIVLEFFMRRPFVSLAELDHGHLTSPGHVVRPDSLDYLPEYMPSAIKGNTDIRVREPIIRLLMKLIKYTVRFDRMLGIAAHPSGRHPHAPFFDSSYSDTRPASPPYLLCAHSSSSYEIGTAASPCQH